MAPKNKKKIEGTLFITSKGSGWLRSPALEEDVEVPAHFLNTGLHKDKVRVLLHPKKKKKSQIGEVIKILKRAKVGFAGTIEKENDKFFLCPTDPKIYTDIIIPKEKLAGASEGQKAFAKIISWDDPQMPPLGKITKVLGEPGEHNAEMKAIVFEKGFELGFPPEIEREAQKILRQAQDQSQRDSEIQKRRDFRDIPTFTIDPDDAKDFDDALSLKEVGSGKFEVGIHIADVSHWVHEGSAIDKEARERGTSVYLVDRTISMLPPVLSDFLCSLRPHEDHFTFSALFTLDEKGRVLDQWFGKSIIHSHHRFTYEEAQKGISENSGPCHRELSVLNRLARVLRKKRFRAGAISLDQPEVKFVLDEDGKPIKIYRQERMDAHRLIEEFMLLANRRVAERIAPQAKGGRVSQGLGRPGLPKEKVFIYRVHEAPDPEKMAELARFLELLGYPVKMKKGVITPEEINRVVAELEGREEKETVQTEIIRAMARAAYSVKNIGHYGLALRHYTHFTSPIRRYPDLIVHRLLGRHLEGKKISQDMWKKYEEISLHCSERERAAQEAEWDSVAYKQTEYMAEHIGETFDAVITSVTEWGIYAEEKETRAEGLIRLRDLSDDWYYLDERQMAIVGEKTKNRFRVGDKIRVRVTKADLGRREIDYEMI